MFYLFQTFSGLEWGSYTFMSDHILLLVVFTVDHPFLNTLYLTLKVQEKQGLMFTGTLLSHLGGKFFAVAVSDRFDSQISSSPSHKLRLGPDKDFGGGFCCVWLAGFHSRIAWGFL